MFYRSFLAIDLPPTVQAQVDGLIHVLRRRDSGNAIRWVQPTQAHVTMVFLGNQVPGELIVALRAAGGRVSAKFPPLLLATTVLGVFPPVGPTRVIYLGCAGTGLTMVRRLHHEFIELVAQLGVAVERRSWQPHITLGRAKSPTFMPLDNIGSAPEKFTASAVTLYQSTLTPSGPRYEQLACFPLGSVAS